MPQDPLIIPQQPNYSLLQTFGNMAAQGVGRIVIDEGDSFRQNLVAGKQPTGWGRLVAWLKGPSAEERIENKATLALFRQSLEAAHGEYVAKFLAARIELTGEVPKPDTELTEQEKQMYRIFIQDTGNLEIQRYNTGLSGFKTEGVQGIDARIGDQQARELHRGGSKYVKE